MKKLVFVGALCIINISLLAQAGSPDTTSKKLYRETATRINDLVYTRLDARFDFSKSHMYGKAWVTLKPHFYPTDSVRLDAKGMEIHKIALVKNAHATGQGTEVPLKYDYDNAQLNIHLDKTYKADEQYTIFIDYTAKPDEVQAKGSAAIREAKGLYFINPRGEDPETPTQIWTQGETEANSVWLPTIDKPNQKMTDEIAMTVPEKYVTLSNGKLVSQKKNTDGTRTDTWKMDLPHAPYLLFMGVGDYAIIKDSYKGKEVSYYVDKQYAPVARKIFGLTPEMIAFYSKITGIDYPWIKYSQITGHEYVSGAMENTTATLHSDAAQQDARELTDGNIWEEVIAHELFHQWFGDLVTTESWSNITLNESFADYAETLWDEYKYGKDAGDEHIFENRQSYLADPANAAKPLVRFYYNDKEDVFDGVSYPKGGAILHMLRNYVGDSAFFKALNLYLNANKFKSAEAHQLRLAFEEVTGKDLNWFWNQWYFGAGHPNLNVMYGYDEAAKKVRVTVSQSQPGTTFKLPVAIDVYSGGSKTRYKVWVQNKTDTFSFATTAKPDLVNFDGDKILLCTKTENKALDEYIYQYKYAGNYVDRRESIDFASQHQDDPKAVTFLKTALKDKCDGLRQLAVTQLDMGSENVKKEMEPILVDLARTDSKRLVKAAAIAKLEVYRKAEYAPLFKAAINDSSYTVAANALEALYEVDSVSAKAEAKRLSTQPAKKKLSYTIAYVLFDESSTDSILTQFESMPVSQNKFNMLQSVSEVIESTKNMTTFKRGIDDVVKLRDAIPQNLRNQTDPIINGVLLKGVAARKKEAGHMEEFNYIVSKLPAEDKKGF